MLELVCRWTVAYRRAPCCLKIIHTCIAYTAPCSLLLRTSSTPPAAPTTSPAPPTRPPLRPPAPTNLRPPVQPGDHVPPAVGRGRGSRAAAGAASRGGRGGAGGAKPPCLLPAGAVAASGRLAGGGRRCGGGRGVGLPWGQPEQPPPHLAAPLPALLPCSPACRCCRRQSRKHRSLQRWRPPLPLAPPSCPQQQQQPRRAAVVVGAAGAATAAAGRARWRARILLCRC